jgi:hypothetical protein
VTGIITGAVFIAVVCALLLGLMLVDRFVVQRRLARERADIKEARRVTGELARVTDFTTHATTILDRPDDERREKPCPDCEGHRCWEWRTSDHTRGCGNRVRGGNSYVGMEDAIRRPGHHTVRETARRWKSHDWSPLRLETRMFLAPNLWARRLPVPVTT